MSTTASITLFKNKEHLIFPKIPEGKDYKGSLPLKEICKVMLLINSSQFFFHSSHIDLVNEIVAQLGLKDDQDIKDITELVQNPVTR